MTWLMVVGWLLGWVLLWRLPRLRDSIGTGAAVGAATEGNAVLRHHVSVVIPVRNEVDRIPRLLASLERQSRRPDQILVVDDGSTDGSAEAASTFPGVAVVAAGPVPPGWTGKPNACATGARLSDGDGDGDILVFLDADVVLGDTAMQSLLMTWEETGGLVSVQPHHHIERPFEAFSLPFNVVALMGLGVGSLLPPKEQWGAAGPCMVASRADYDRVGGHASVAGEVAEDLALADRFRQAGLDVHCYGGHDQLGFRMYRNARDLFQGWAKNVATGARHTPLLRAAGVAVWIAALASMAITLVASPVGSMGWSTLGLIYVLGAVQVSVLGARVGRFGIAGLVWPVLILGFLVIFGVSLVQTAVLRRVWWSGRAISLQRQG